MYRYIYINSQFIKLYTISGRDGINSQGVAYSRRLLCAVDGALSQIIFRLSTSVFILRFEATTALFDVILYANESCIT